MHDDEPKKEQERNEERFAKSLAQIIHHTEWLLQKAKWIIKAYQKNKQCLNPLLHHTQVIFIKLLERLSICEKGVNRKPDEAQLHEVEIELERFGSMFDGKCRFSYSDSWDVLSIFGYMLIYLILFDVYLKNLVLFP